MTLITFGNSEGSRRCDAKCYEASGSDCDCVCGGLNHGAGLQRATDQTRELAGDMLKQVEARGGVIADELRQLVLA